MISDTDRLKALHKTVSSVPSCRSVKATREIVKAHDTIEFIMKREQIKETLYRFTNESAKLTWSGGPSDFASKLLLVWKHELQRLFRIYDRPRDSSLCNEHCGSAGALIVINQQLCLYGCVLHGTVHDCSVRYAKNDKDKWIAQPRQCACTRITTSHDIVCVFSGEVIGKYLTQASTKSKDFSTTSAGARRAAGFTYRMALIEKEEITDLFENRDAAQRPPPSPQQQQKQKPLKRKREERESFVVQKTHKVGRLQLTAEQMQKLNASYVVQRRTEQILAAAKRRAAATAETVIDEVVYDKAVRQLINTEMLTKVHDKMSQQLIDYHYACKREGTFPVFTRCVSAFVAPLLEVKLLREVDCDMPQRTRFAARVLRLWELCNKSPAKLTGAVSKSCTLKQLALAVLYSMREGMYIEASADEFEKITLIPRDETLWLDLPEEGMLTRFGAEKRRQLHTQLSRGARKRGTSEAQEHSDFSHGTAAKRKVKQRKAQSSFNSRRINVASLPPLTERDLTPAYFLDEALCNDSSYASRDITVGLDFLRVCIESFDESNRSTLAEMVEMA